jgi:hypothetical protein
MAGQRSADGAAAALNAQSELLAPLNLSPQDACKVSQYATCEPPTSLVGIQSFKEGKSMQTDEQPLLQRIASTLDQILAELRKGSERHDQLDQSNAEAEELRKDPFSNV